MRKKKSYILTDSCFFHEGKNKRSKHWIEIVDLDTGAVERIGSGSVIQIVKSN